MQRGIGTSNGIGIGKALLLKVKKCMQLKMIRVEYKGWIYRDCVVRNCLQQ